MGYTRGADDPFRFQQNVFFSSVTWGGFNRRKVPWDFVTWVMASPLSFLDLLSALPSRKSGGGKAEEGITVPYSPLKTIGIIVELAIWGGNSNNANV